MGNKSLFKNKQENNYSNIPSNPEICQVVGCGCDTHIIFTQVRDGMGRILIGSFSRFGDSSHRTMHEGFTFIRFIVRCADCYQNDLISAVRKKGFPSTHHMQGDIKPSVAQPQDRIK